MLLIRAILLWSIISVHVVGFAAIFRLLFPKESSWLGFLVPSVAFVIAMNFTEHLVALPSLLWLLPFTICGSIWSIFNTGLKWKGFRLPTGIFLASFAFTLALRAVRPEIAALRDGIIDLGLMSSFCMGDKVPPPMAWFPALPLSHYYVIGHYGMSLLTRLLNVDLGTGFNLSSALVSAFDCFLAAAAAWRIGRQKIWIAILAPILLEGASTGATAYLWFTNRSLNPNEADDLFSGYDNPNSHNPLLQLIRDGCRHELVPPGAWSWIGSFHSTTGGLFLVLFFVWTLMEVLRRKASNWPWICMGLLPFLTIITSTWALPLEGILSASALFWIIRGRFFPESLRVVMLGLGIALSLISPTLLEFLTTSTFVGGGWTDPKCRVQLVEFLVLWWPTYLPLVALLFVWSKLQPAVKVIIFAVPLTFLVMEIYTVGNPYDWTGKLWGYIYGAGWIALLPEVFRQRAVFFKALTGLIIVSSLISFWAWTSYFLRDGTLNSDDCLHLEGTGSFRWDATQHKVLLTLSQVKGKTILTGMPDDGVSPFYAAFSGNRIYVAWAGLTDVHVSGTDVPMAREPGRQVETFYQGKCADPLLFLREHDISAVVISPEDKMETGILEDLKRKLSPFYEYVDCEGEKSDVGVFLFRPGVKEQASGPP